MLHSVLTEYLQRFSGAYTESVYNAKGIEDYNYMRRCYDYLECEKSIFSQPRTCPAGLRNIGNTCYLNTILQLLFHINYMREKICTSDILPTKLHQRLQFLLGTMAVGKMPFADPTEVFEELRAGNSQVFAPGVQNDFHEVFTLLIDCISQGYKKTSPEESRFIKKLLFGKMTTKISYLDDKINKNAEFNIINLDSSEGSFSKALEKWKRYSISDFTTPNGQRVTAQCENLFVQTPALMGFFINRVTYKKGKLQKDCQPFAFEDSILVAKAYQSDKTVMAKSFSDEKQKQLNTEKAQLLEWLRKSEAKRESIQETIKYLKEKEVPLLSEPTIQNPLGEAARLQCLQFLQKEMLLISKRAQDTQAEISKLQQQMSQLQQEQNCQRYLLWGMMIHQGNSATFGHYKLCLQLGSQWYEFNDKLVSKIPRESINKYNERGEICCLFYKRPTLICDNKKIPIPFQLKTKVSQYENNLKLDIDKSRVLQLLYQETESVAVLLQHQMKMWQYESFQFFFKPIQLALCQKFDLQTCKGILLQELITSPQFVSSLQEKLINHSDHIQAPINSFKVLQPYYHTKQHLCAFLDREITTVEVGLAYKELSQVNLKCENSIRGAEILNEMLEVIILKGLYYFKCFSELDCENGAQVMSDLSEGLDRLLEKSKAEEFSLVCISIKASAEAELESNKAREKASVAFQSTKIQDYGEYFCKSFRFWVEQRKNLSKLDETNYLKGCPSFKTKLRYP